MGWKALLSVMQGCVRGHKVSLTQDLYEMKFQLAAMDGELESNHLWRCIFLKVDILVVSFCPLE